MADAIVEDSFLNHEIPFCKIYNNQTREIVEELFLKNRISFYIQYNRGSIIKKLFSSDREQNSEITVRINEADEETARNLVEGMSYVKLQQAV